MLSYLRLTTQTKSLAGLRRGWSSISVGETSLAVHSLGTTFPYVWLRDSCQSPDCVHPSTSQKLHRTSDIPQDIRPRENGVEVVSDGINVHWITGHQSFYPKSFLERHSSFASLFKYHKDVPQQPWNSSRISSTPTLFLPYASLQNPTGLLTAIDQLSSYGLLFVTGVPNDETSNETCELRTLAELFGEIRHTFYGQLWNVKNIRNSRNIAYTNLDLGLHMDLLYFQHPPRFQILHCLRNRVSGGTSIFVDALHAAATLRATNPSDFDVLSTTPVAFHYINDGHHLRFEHPTIELGGPQTNGVERPIAHINYSPPFQAPLLLHSTPPTFYPALAHFVSLLEDPANTYEYTLREGDAVLFDNRRVLHARTAFHDKEHNEDSQDTNRWLKGCYIEADPVLDRGRVLRKKLEQEHLSI